MLALQPECTGTGLAGRGFLSAHVSSNTNTMISTIVIVKKKTDHSRNKVPKKRLSSKATFAI